MEIYELRPSNYIKIGSTITKVESVSSLDGIIQSNNFADRHIKDFEPIPLKDWLDKFGLNKYNIDGFRFLKVGNFSFEYSDENNILYINDSGTKIKYVHQLQNAIFDLTEQIIL